MGKYLFFDIDGTLLSDVTHTVPQSAIEAIKKAKENGHHCFFCTGRSYFMTSRQPEAFTGNFFYRNRRCNYCEWRSGCS
ncbi:HAD hydrolase family protein [Catenibacterium sp.]|uniref:HAD hydrolase family protein n=1 Tax=Catenibacterium sp. TaxID=2049022 RepID=UPI003FD8E05C